MMKSFTLRLNRQTSQRSLTLSVLSVYSVTSLTYRRQRRSQCTSKQPKRHCSRAQKAFFERLAGAGELTVSEKAETSDDMVTIVTANARIFMPMGELVDKEKELAKT